MEKKGVYANGACTCCLGHKPELQAALVGIRHNLGCKAVRLERLSHALANSLRMVVCSAVFAVAFSGVPCPFLFCYHMVAEHDRRPGHRHEAPEEICLTVVEVLDRNGPHVAAGKRFDYGLHDIFGIARHLLSVEGGNKRDILLVVWL
jgi:hypothetical protein